jgi:PKD repeat protein
VPIAKFGHNKSVCVNTAQTFTDSSTALTGTISQWNWNFGDGSPVVHATTNAAQVHTFTTPGTYYVTLSVVTSTGCTSAVYSDSIVINAIPSVALGQFAGVCNNTNAFTLTGGTPVSAQGVGTGVYSGPGVNGGVFNPSTAGVGTANITYTYTSQAGCSASAIQPIVVSQAVILSIGQVAPLCNNDAAVTLVPSVAGGIFAGTGVEGNSFNPAVAGAGSFNITYSIPSNSCSVAASATVVVHPAPTDVNAGPGLSTVLGIPVLLTGSSNAGTYAWTPTTGLTNPSSLTTQANPDQTTVYTLTATNSFGCKASDTMTLEVTVPCIDPAKVFTPNNDGLYDKWNVFSGSCVS